MSGRRTIRRRPSRSRTAPTWCRSISAGRNSARLVLAPGIAPGIAIVIALAAARGASASPAPADTLRYPYVAALSRSTDERRVYFCAGTLVAPQWILTAAHCFRAPGGARISETDLWAEVGASWLADVPEIAQVRVARIVVHPGYDPQSQANDLALVRLERIAGPLIADLAPAHGAADPADPAEAVVLGFGSLYEGRLAANALLPNGRSAAQVSDRLRQATVRLLPSAECADAAAAGQICAGAAADETCIGDSGGPLIVADASGADRLAGIDSFGSGCAAERPVVVYTRVSAYAAWIAEVIAGR